MKLIELMKIKRDNVYKDWPGISQNNGLYSQQLYQSFLRLTLHRPNGKK